MLRKKRKIAVIVDNCPAHQKIAGLKCSWTCIPASEYHLKNTANGSRNYTKPESTLPKASPPKFIKSIDRDETPNINVLDALHLLSQALNCVTSSTVSNCFGHAGFAQPDPVPPAPEEDDDFDNDNV